MYNWFSAPSVNAPLGNFYTTSPRVSAERINHLSNKKTYTLLNYALVGNSYIVCKGSFLSPS